MNKCKWIAEGSVCNYSTPQFDNKTIGFICLLTTFLTIPFSIIFDHLLEILEAPLYYTDGRHSVKSEYYRLKHIFFKPFTAISSCKKDINDHNNRNNSSVINTEGKDGFISELFRLNNKITKPLNSIIPENSDIRDHSYKTKNASYAKGFLEFIRHIKFIGDLLSKNDQALFYNMWRLDFDNAL